jgi:hypothetical protein
MGRETDAKVKSEVDLMKVPGYPELYLVEVEHLVRLYMDNRK